MKSVRAAPNPTTSPKINVPIGRLAPPRPVYVIARDDRIGIVRAGGRIGRPATAGFGRPATAGFGRLATAGFGRKSSQNWTTQAPPQRQTATPSAAAAS